LLEGNDRPARLGTVREGAIVVIPVFLQAPPAKGKTWSQWLAGDSNRKNGLTRNPRSSRPQSSQSTERSKWCKARHGCCLPGYLSRHLCRQYE
jgi:hypothetical protein